MYWYVTNNQLSSQISALAAQVAALTVVQKAQAAQLTALINQGEKIMASLDDDITAIQQQTTLVASLTTFVQGLQAQIAAALPGLTADQQAKIDAIFAGATANNTAIANAMVANTPAAPQP